MVALTESPRAPAGRPLRDPAERRASSPTLDRYPRFARRHAALLAYSMCAGLFVGLSWALLAPQTYSATASVVLSPVPSYVSTATSGREPRQVTIDSDAQLFRDPRVMQAVAGAVGQDPGVVADNVVLTAAPLSRVLLLTFTTDTAAKAAAGATAGAEAFIDVRRDSLGALQEDQIGQLRYRIALLTDRLNARGQPNPLTSAEDPLASQIAELRDRLVDLESTRTSPAEVSRRAVAPSAPDPTNKEVPVTSGVMMGFLAGCVIGAARDMLRSRRRQSGTYFLT